jgi:hypothetical protein
MAEQSSIRNEGEGAKEAFLQFVPGSRASDNAKRGNVLVAVDGEEHYVQIRECHYSEGKGGDTINQVRPIKFITCVVWAPNLNRWYVLAPDQLVRLAASKNRGHHNEIPFECMQFSLRSLSAEYHITSSDSELAAKVQTAIRRGAAAIDMGVTGIPGCHSQTAVGVSGQWID